MPNRSDRDGTGDFYLTENKNLIKFEIMKIKLVPIFLLFLFSAGNAQTINWVKDFKEAKALAVETGKPIMLDFTANWCKPCQEMEKSFWPRPDVSALVQNFVAVKVDFDDEPGLARKYFVSAIPNVVTTDPWGNGLRFSRGFGSPEKILDHLTSIPKDFSAIKDFVQQLETDKNDLTALNKLSEFYTQNKLYYQSNEYDKRLLKLETEAPKREDLMIKIGLNFLRSAAPDEAEDVFKDFQKEFPESPQNEVALFGLSFAGIQKDKIKAAKKFLDKLKADYPNSPYIVQLEREMSKGESKRD